MPPSSTSSSILPTAKFPYSSTCSSASASSSIKDKMPNSIPRIGSLASTNESETRTRNRARSASETLLLDSISGNFDVHGSVPSVDSVPTRVEEATQTEELDMTMTSSYFDPASGEPFPKDPHSISEAKSDPIDPKTNPMKNETPSKAPREASKDRPDSKAANSSSSEQDMYENQVEGSSSINQQTKLIVPPLNFDLVNAGLYRSGHPNERNFDFMKGLGLNGIVYLAQETYLPSVKDWAIREGVKVYQFGLSVNKEPFAEMEASKVLSLLEILLDSRNHPMLIHCNKGKYRVGCIVALIRRLQNWSHTSLFEEFERFAGGRGRGADLEFIETFDLAKVRFNPTFKPSWL